MEKKPRQPRKTKEKWPKVEKGTHLTVTTFEDGTVQMEWDHDALQRECEEAIASVEKKK